MRKKRLPLIMLFFMVTISVAACNARIKGSGDLITETRSVSDFDRIELSGPGEVILTQAGSESLSIETDDNVMEQLKVEVEDGTLKLGFKSGINFITPSRLIFYVGVDDLNGLTVSGSGDIKSDQLETDRLDVSVSGSGAVQIANLSTSEVKADISGSGGIDLTGDAAAQDITMSGAGQYLGSDLCSQSVKVNLSGSGDAKICAIDTLDARTSGSGSVNYYGQPALINSSSSGSGTINNLGEK